MSVSADLPVKAGGRRNMRKAEPTPQTENNSLRRLLANAVRKVTCPRLRWWLERLLAGDAKEREEKNAARAVQGDSCVHRT